MKSNYRVAIGTIFTESNHLAVDGKIRPAMTMAKVPVVVGAVNAGTEGQGPIAAVRSQFQMKVICTGSVNFGGCCNLKWGILQWSG